MEDLIDQLETGDMVKTKDEVWACILLHSSHTQFVCRIAHSENQTRYPPSNTIVINREEIVNLQKGFGTKSFHFKRHN